MRLAKRKTAKVYNLAEFIKKNNANELFVATQIVADSIRSAVRIYNPFTWTNLFFTFRFLFNHYDPSEIFGLLAKVDLLEGGKKKVVMEKSLEETLQKDSLL